jgi:hypothetical protein
VNPSIDEQICGQDGSAKMTSAILAVRVSQFEVPYPVCAESWSEAGENSRIIRRIAADDPLGKIVKMG